jgi:transposase InsO family protein
MHQLWVTDITYFKIAGRFAYIVVIQDVYTRLIISAVASTSLRAESNIEALTRALDATKEQRRGIQTIHHSDRGSQYIASEYLKLLAEENIHPSMCMAAYENAYVERVIGTLKNEYLNHRGIRNIEHLVEELDRTVLLYNISRPHSSHPKYMTPAAFAEYINGLQEQQRPVMTIYDSRQDEEPGQDAGPEAGHQE